MEIKRLGELCNIVSGGTPSRTKTEFWNNGTIPWVKIGDIKEKYINETDEFITKEGLDGSSTKMLPAGTILYTIFATLGEVGILEIAACTNQAIAGIMINDIKQLNTDYLYYYLKSKKTYVNRVGRGVAQNNINMSMLKALEVPVPELSKQLEIVKVIDKAYEVIEDRKQELKCLDNLIRARFVEMFGDPVLNEKGWKIVTVGDIVTEVRYGTSKPAVEGGKYPYLRMNNLTADGHLDLKDLKYIDISEDEIEKCVVRKGDVLFNRTNSIELVGKTAVFDLTEEMVIAGYIIRVRLTKEMLPVVFSQYMNLEPLKVILRGMAKGAVNQANINAQELQSIKVYIPDMKLQNQFADFVQQIDKSKDSVQKALDEAQLLFDSLMQQYFG
ncbi:type I restriction endonuclease subunit S [Clostridium sp. MCC344]|nr:restriction endonuclease subunit S [Clostridium sp. MCC344]MBS7001303.1 restriction endonuclease subunit S [Clostridiaceae bacterium]MBT9791264.1 type I restriction endonuclease subunit S [Clostridium sp. MCC344]